MTILDAYRAWIEADNAFRSELERQIDKRGPAQETSVPPILTALYDRFTQCRALYVALLNT